MRSVILVSNWNHNLSFSCLSSRALSSRVRDPKFGSHPFWEFDGQIVICMTRRHKLARVLTEIKKLAFWEFLGASFAAHFPACETPPCAFSATKPRKCMGVEIGNGGTGHDFSKKCRTILQLFTPVSNLIYPLHNPLFSRIRRNQISTTSTIPTDSFLSLIIQIVGWNFEEA